MTKKLKTNFVSAIILSSILLLQLVVLAVPAAAHEYVQISIVIRKGPGVDDDDIKKSQVNQTLKKMEDILNKCRTSFEPFIKFTPIFKKMLTDSDGKVTYPRHLEFDDQNELRDDKMVDESWEYALNDEMLRLGKGSVSDSPPIFTFYLVHSIISTKPNVIGVNVLGSPVGAVTPGLSPSGWVHEFGHGAGLEHDDAPRDNVMHEKDRGGKKLTTEQCKKMNELIEKIGIVKKSNYQQGIIYDGTLEKQSIIVAMAGEPKDRDSEKTVPRYGFLNPFLAWYVFDPIDADKKMELTLNLEESFPRDHVEATYLIYYDTDNNKDTGFVIGDFVGIDKIITLDVSGKFPFTGSDGIIDGTIMDTATERTSELATSYVTAIFLADSGRENPLFDSITFSVSAQQLGELPENRITAGFESYSGNVLNIIPEMTIATTNKIQPTLDTYPLVVADQSVKVQGTDFAPNSVVSLLWDGNPEPMTSVSTDSVGSFTTTIDIPNVLSGDYLLDAIDEEDNVGLVVLTVEPPEPLPPNGGSPPSQFLILSVEPTDQVGNSVSSFTKEFDSYVKVTVSASEPTQALINVNLIYQDDTIETVGLHKTIFPTGISEMIFSHNVLDKFGDARLSAEAYSDWQDKGGKEITNQVEEKVTIR